MADDPKRVAAAILGPLSSDPEESGESGAAEPKSGEMDMESTALEATADQMIESVKSGDRAGLVDALRSLVTMLRT